MKVLATIISISLALFLLCVGCSREEPAPAPSPKTPVRRPIIMPPLEKAATGITGGEEKAETQESEGGEQKAKTEETEGGGEKAIVEESEGGEVKTAAMQERAVETPEAGAGEEAEPEDVIGWYIVKKGESLATIAAREDVYGDALKWPILYRLNMDRLGALESSDGLPHGEAPEGLRLRILSPDEIKENLTKLGQKAWVASVLSGTTDREIIPAAITLMRNGYSVYIIRAKVGERDWMRLRAGFFKDRTDADTEAKKIRSLLNVHDSWITNVGKQELEEFGGYYREEKIVEKDVSEPHQAGANS